MTADTDFSPRQRAALASSICDTFLLRRSTVARLQSVENSDKVALRRTDTVA